MKRFIVVLYALVILTGCASVAPVTTQTKIIDRPALNTLQREELGNTLLEYFVSNTQPSLRVLESWGLNSSKRLPPQILRPLGVGEKFSKFHIDDAPPNTLFTRTICYDPSASVFFLPNGLDACDPLGRAMANTGPVRVEPADFVDVRAAQFRQELIYNGKIGNNVKFLYREISGGMMRAPFTQDIQYDLSEGNIIGFKGARIEIISSTNRFIEYKVLSTFNK